MVSPDLPPLQEPLLVFHRRAPALTLPEDPGPEELAQYWTLSSRDKEEIAQCRGEGQRRRFAVQLCTLRTYGRFLPKAVAAPVAITNYLARQLDLPLVLFGDIPERLATETDHLQRIRLYLGWHPFDEEARGRFPQWLTQRATDDVLPSALLPRAEAILRQWQVVLPAPSTLEALIASVTARVQDDLYTRLVTSLSPALQQALDTLLEVPAGERTSVLFQLKEYPPEASPAVILRYIERYHFLQDLGVDAIAVSPLSAPMSRYFADVTKHYDVRALRRLPEAKR